MRQTNRVLLSGLQLVLLSLFTHNLLAERDLRARSLAQTKDSVSLAWDANAEEERVTGYLLEYKAASAEAWTRLDLGNVTAYTLTGLQPGTLYQVRVSAYSKLAGEGSLWQSEPSAPLAVKTEAEAPPPAFVCSAFGDAPVSVIVQDFDLTVRRSDPRGALVRFEAGSADPITRVEFDLEGDGEPAVPLVFPVGVGFDGRYVRAIAFKPTANGTWPLVVSAIDSAGRRGGTRCLPGMTVTF